MYPWVLKYCPFPVGGDYKSITTNFDYTLKSYTYGLVSCQILPPTNLHIPILPAKINNKLLFSLCYTCSLINNQTLICNHTRNEKSFYGTWVLLEIKYALKKTTISFKFLRLWYGKNLKNIIL